MVCNPFVSSLIVSRRSGRARMIQPLPRIVPKLISGHGMFLCGQQFFARSQISCVFFSLHGVRGIAWYGTVRQSYLVSLVHCPCSLDTLWTIGCRLFRTLGCVILASRFPLVGCQLWVVDLDYARLFALKVWVQRFSFDSAS